MKKGFTLIELLVVISIIGVLSTTIIGSLNKVRKKAEVTKLKATLSQLKTGLELYYLDHGRYPPVGENEGYINVCSSSSVLIEDLKPYIKTRKFNLNSQLLFGNEYRCLLYRPFLENSLCGNSSLLEGQIYEIQFITPGGEKIKPYWKRSYNSGSIEIQCMLPPN